MSETRRVLTTCEAEAVVERRIERTVAAMNDEAWHAWLERNVGPLDAADLQTTES